MTPTDREAVRANAAYLRNVRPIDPGEIAGYVDSQPHPAAVRAVLRDLAGDLVLVERDDGTFAPPPDDPVAAPLGTVEAVPDRHLDRLHDLIADRYGPSWFEGETGERLRGVIRRIKDDYYRGRDVTYDADAALGYAVYHLPDFYAAIQYVLEDLVGNGLLERSLRVLDVGAGVGGPALGLVDRLPDDAFVEYHAVEPSAAADVLEPLLDGAGRNVHPTIHRTRVEEFAPDGEFDLVVFANVLSELDDPVAAVDRLAGSLADDGAVVLLSPADKQTSTGLRTVERALVGDLGVYSPTLRLWPDHEPAGRCWSFDVRPDLDPPTVQTRLDEAAGATGEFVNVDVQYSYAILRRDGERRVDVRGDPRRHARLADTERHVTNRIDCLGVKLSHDLGGRNPLYLVGDGSEAVDHFAVRTTGSSLTRDLTDAPYGAVLRFERVLVLWNDDEAAYNLVVDDESIVDRVG